MSITYDIVKSWSITQGAVNSMDDIRNWLQQRAVMLTVNIKKVPFSYHGFWHYDEKDGFIRNNNNSFFQLAGYQVINDDDRIISEQPLIIQNEIGYLGIICQKINGVLHFLMQAKIEPGNINHIQLSPTIQATKSNFTRMHGGNSPAYLDYFVNSSKHRIIVDQIQSEQASRFYKKRNRNIILYVDDRLKVLDSHKWMTLGQIKELMRDDNVVNMDTRTVLSCLPIVPEDLTPEEWPLVKELFQDQPLYVSAFEKGGFSTIHRIFNQINDYKMFNNNRARFVPLKSLKNWELREREIVCKTPYDFKVIYCYIEIEGREVQYWEQPLVEANGIAVLGLFTAVIDGIRKFLVSIKHEIGSFDGAELGPTIQLEPTNPRTKLNFVEDLFLHKLKENRGVRKNVLLSEEGGRFYHEQNRNCIIEIDPSEIDHLPKGYFWMDYRTLNRMIQYNNCLNIQLRNLLAILDL